LINPHIKYRQKTNQDKACQIHKHHANKIYTFLHTQKQQKTGGQQTKNSKRNSTFRALYRPNRYSPDHIQRKQSKMRT